MDDVLRSRVRTSGIITEQYDVKGHIFECVAAAGGGKGGKVRMGVCVEGIVWMSVCGKGRRG